jgi:hypothetical protein
MRRVFFLIGTKKKRDSEVEPLISVLAKYSLIKKKKNMVKAPIFIRAFFMMGFLFLHK